MKPRAVAIREKHAEGSLQKDRCMLPQLHIHVEIRVQIRLYIQDVAQVFDCHLVLSFQSDVDEQGVRIQTPYTQDFLSAMRMRLEIVKAISKHRSLAARKAAAGRIKDEAREKLIEARTDGMLPAIIWHTQLLL